MRDSLPLNHRSFRYNGYAVSLRCDHRTVLAWLESVLSPHFELGDETQCDCAVTFQCDSTLYGSLRRSGPARNGDRVECFTLDGTFRSHSLWRGAAADTTIYDEEFDVFYCLASGCAVIRIIAERLKPQCHIALMRVVRELATSHSLRQGCLHVHGSAIAIADKGVIISGPKGAGKTTLLLAMLQEGAARFMANDRLLVHPAGTLPSARGMPTIVKIRGPTLRMFPRLLQRLQRQESLNWCSVRDSTPQSSTPDNSEVVADRKMTQAQFCDLVQVDSTAQAHLWTLVFPTIVSDGIQALRLIPMTPDEAAHKLFAGLLRASVQPRLTAFATTSDQPLPDQDQIREICHQIVSKVRCFECQMDRAGLQGSLTTFLQRLTQ